MLSVAKKRTANERAPFNQESRATSEVHNTLENDGGTDATRSSILSVYYEHADWSAH
jgi:hypothetical protein